MQLKKIYIILGIIFKKGIGQIQLHNGRFWCIRIKYYEVSFHILYIDSIKDKTSLRIPKNTSGFKIISIELVHFPEIL